MRKLVEFLLARMETHPEEFYQDRKTDVKHNWMHTVKDSKKFLTDEEYKAIWEKVSEINLAYTMERVTEKLFEPENEDIYEAYDGYRTATKLVASHEQIEALKLAQQRNMAQMQKAISTSVFELERKVPFKMEGRYESDKDNG